MPYVRETLSRSILGAAPQWAMAVQSVLTASLSPAAAARSPPATRKRARLLRSAGVI